MTLVILGGKPLKRALIGTLRVYLDRVSMPIVYGIAAIGIGVISYSAGGGGGQVMAQEPPPAPGYFAGLEPITCESGTPTITPAEMEALYVAMTDAQTAHLAATAALDSHTPPTVEVHIDETSGSPETTTSSAPLDAEGMRLQEQVQAAAAAAGRAQNAFVAAFDNLCGDTLPPPLPQGYSTQPEPAYNPALDHPEIYGNEDYGITAAVADDRAMVINLGGYTGRIEVTTSVWMADSSTEGGGYFTANPDFGGNQHRLEREGQTLRVYSDTDPTITRFRIDGIEGGLPANLVLGYMDGHTDN